MSSLDNLDKMIERARALQGTRDPADDFTDEDAPQASPYDEDEEEELDDEPQPITVKQKKHRREAAKLTVTLDKGAEALTYALRQLTTAINSIAPASSGAKPSDPSPVSVSVSVTVNVDATPLVEKLTDGVRVATGGAREGVLSKALRETLSDLGAPSVSALLKKDASQFVKILGRRLDEVETTPLEFSEEEDDDAPPVEIPQEPRPRVETAQPVDLTPQEEPQRVDVTDEDAAKLVKRIKLLVGCFKSQDRPKLLPILTRFGAGRWEDIPRDKLAEARDAVRDLMGVLYGEEE